MNSTTWCKIIIYIPKFYSAKITAIDNFVCILQDFQEMKNFLMRYYFPVYAVCLY